MLQNLRAEFTASVILQTNAHKNVNQHTSNTNISLCVHVL